MENKEEIKNGLNNTALAALFSLWSMVQSPMFIIMKKMEDFETFGDFLQQAMKTSEEEFIPELVPHELEDDNSKED